MSDNKDFGPSLRPSRSERPGLNRLLATIMVDPWFLVFKLVAVIVGSAVQAVMKHNDARKLKKRKKKGEHNG